MHNATFKEVISKITEKSSQNNL